MLSAFNYKETLSYNGDMMLQLINADSKQDQTVKGTMFIFDFDHFIKLDDDMLIY